jgi:diketogulonate reductase-like aldo/keto reductase
MMRRSRALRNSGLPHDQVFITTKFNQRRKDPVAEAQQSLRRLGVDQVDLYLVHWPQGGPLWAWPGCSTFASWDTPVPSASPTSALAN